jgi:signal recognition particle subunit SRP72
VTDDKRPFFVMARNPTVSLSSLLSSSTIDDHEEWLKQANDDLKKDKTNQGALHKKVVALLRLDRFEDALRALDDGGDTLSRRCEFEKAYALYKTGRLEEAAKVVEVSSEDSRGLKHVAAQVAYRSERFEDAARIYEELSAEDTAVNGEENDLRINGSATDVQLEWQGNGEKVAKSRRKPGREDLEAFESAYNVACGYIARGDLRAGSLLLKRARDLCEALDDLTDEEKKAEVLPIMVQQVYVLTRMGKLEEAGVLQKEIHIAECVHSHLFLFLTDQVRKHS